MLILTKKRIILMLCMVFVSLYAFSFKIANNEPYQNEKTAQTVATPVSNKVVIVDAGHGSPDVGVSLLHKVKNKSNYSFIKN